MTLLVTVLLLLVTVLLLIALVVVYRGQVRIRHLENALAFYADEWELKAARVKRDILKMLPEPVWVWTSDGIRDSEKIALDQDVIAGLVSFYERERSIREKD